MQQRIQMQQSLRMQRHAATEGAEATAEDADATKDTDVVEDAEATIEDADAAEAVEAKGAEATE